MPNLKLTRVAQGLSQIDLQIKTKIPQSKISHAERGVLPLKKEEKQKIEKALGTKIDWNKENSKGGQDK
jgi:ribosome-binding protein aMBF1 (putative translation factor)